MSNWDSGKLVAIHFNIVVVLTDHRYDYIPRPCKGEKQFMVHMPSYMHDGVAGALNKLVISWLNEIQKGEHCTANGNLNTTTMVAKEMDSFLAARVKVDSETHQEPDLSFSYKAGRPAGLVIEVARSQYKLKLAERADRYIKGTEGKIHTVVGINLNDIYNGGRGAWFSIWNAKFDDKGEWWTREITVDQQVREFLAVSCHYGAHNDLAAQMFINDEGQPVKDCKLCLSLKDFVSKKRAVEIGDFQDVTIQIPSEELHRFYERSLQPHVCAEIDDEQEVIRKEVEEDLKEVSEMEKLLQSSGKLSSGEGQAVGLEEVKKAREILTEAERHISKRRSNLENLKMTLDRVGDKTSDDVKEATEMLLDAEKKLVELEKKILEMRPEVERKAPPETEDTNTDLKIRRASRMGAVGPSISQTSSPTSSVKATRKSKARLSWSRKKENQAGSLPR